MRGENARRKNVYLFANHHIFPPSCGSSFQRCQTFHQLAGLHIVCSLRNVHTLQQTASFTSLLRQSGFFPWDLPDRTVKNKTPRHIPRPRASISGTLTTLIGWSAMTLPDSSFSPAFQSMQAENGSSDKRCSAMTVHFLALVPDETIVPRALGGSTRYRTASISMG